MPSCLEISQMIKDVRTIEVNWILFVVFTAFNNDIFVMRNDKFQQQEKQSLCNNLSQCDGF